MITNNKITVLHLCDKFGVSGSSIHGVSRLFSWWFPRFDTKRIDAHLYGMKTEDPGGQTLKKMGIDITFLGKSKYDPTVVLNILNVIKTLGPDVIDLHGYAACTFGRIAAAIANVPAIVHEYFVDDKMPFYQAWADALLARYTAKSVACSESVKEFLVTQRKVSAEDALVYYYGVPLDEFTVPSPEEIAAERRQWKIPSDHKVVGIVGRLHEVKGHRYFLAAAKQVLRTHPKTTFLICGDGALYDELKVQTRRLGITNNVIFTGYYEDLALAVSLFDIMVIASLSEGAPIALLEAMAYGRAIVSTDAGGIKEIVNDGQTGLLVPIKNAAAIANKVIYLLNNEAVAKHLQRNALKEIQNFSIESIVHKLEDLYEEVAQQKRSK